MKWWRRFRKGPPVNVCSFCGKNSRQVHKIVAGPGVCICNECVEICNQVLNDEDVPSPHLG